MAKVYQARIKVLYDERRAGRPQTNCPSPSGPLVRGGYFEIFTVPGEDLRNHIGERGPSRGPRDKRVPHEVLPAVYPAMRAEEARDGSGLGCGPDIFRSVFHQ